MLQKPEMLKKKTKHHVVAIDFDGCTDTKFARAKLSDAIANDVITHPHIEVIEIIVASLRQSFLLDYFNAIHKGKYKGVQSCTLLLEDFFYDLHWKIGLLFKKNKIQRPVPRITFNSLLLSDILNYLQDGTTFDMMSKYRHYTLTSEKMVAVKSREGKKVSLAYYNRQTDAFEAAATNAAFEFADTSKILLLWVHMHYFAEKYGKNTPFIYRFVDDVPEILNGIRSFFGAYPGLIPKKCALACESQSTNVHIYPSILSSDDLIQGTGDTNQYYRGIYWDIAFGVEQQFSEQDTPQKTKMIKHLLLESLDKYKHTSAPETSNDVEEEVELIMKDTPTLWDRDRPSISTESEKFKSLFFEINKKCSSLNPPVAVAGKECDVSQLRSNHILDKDISLALKKNKLEDSPVSIVGLTK